MKYYSKSKKEVKKATKPQLPMVTIEIPEKTYKKLEEIRKDVKKEGAGIDDVLWMLIEEYSKKKRLPPEVVDQAEVT